VPLRPLLRRPVPTGAYARVPCWWSAERWLEHVERVYRRHYLPVRHRLVATTGGGISLPTVLAVAAEHADAADFGTGRNSWPLLGKSGAERGMTATTGRGERTISRARTFLRLVGLATEVQEGRQRTLLERLDSAERDDKGLNARRPRLVPDLDAPGRSRCTVWSLFEYGPTAPAPSETPGELRMETRPFGTSESE